jgi:hypothetical protein
MNQKRSYHFKVLHQEQSNDSESLKVQLAV